MEEICNNIQNYLRFWVYVVQCLMKQKIIIFLSIKPQIWNNFVMSDFSKKLQKTRQFLDTKIVKLSKTVPNFRSTFFRA